MPALMGMMQMPLSRQMLCPEERVKDIMRQDWQSRKGSKDPQTLLSVQMPVLTLTTVVTEGRSRRLIVTAICTFEPETCHCIRGRPVVW